MNVIALHRLFSVYCVVQQIPEEVSDGSDHFGQYIALRALMRQRAVALDGLAKHDYRQIHCAVQDAAEYAEAQRQKADQRPVDEFFQIKP